MNDELPDYAALERALGRVENDVSAAEIHGVCCGMLVVDQASSQDVWLGHVLQGDPQNFHFQEVRTLLRQLFIVTRQQMNDSGMGFELFLPDDDDLEAQVEAMQEWCQGFSYGLAAAGIRDMKKLPTDSREWAEDVVRIGSSGELDLDNEEESENALAEILEYLRVGVLMMVEEMQPMKAAPQVH
ncbi:MAG TPA: UPF0149 family protein [Candidatus Thiothrix moscowensis]|uniref:UPF0149 family protein n=1 Tax=unclassified Thiothrix TaxID=2636184 RepID=UPI001A17FC86|nr:MULTISPECIES: UPF0149 family protein [unclassified Thiothrix]MBJ6609674.1 UPF0149 family protein [Candidatus Thiothrix moscowensis]HRJ53859.1 UPF0149 family protein [Candidatus Thiothrix moscowensis]HRJ93941.1 UPF0149 family protein [Candidatus Thiothrix moscowensis]